MTDTPTESPQTTPSLSGYADPSALPASNSVDQTPSPVESKPAFVSNPFPPPLEDTPKKIPSPSPQQEEYAIKCPDFISPDVLESHRIAFKEAEIEADKAQKVVDKLVSLEEQHQQRHLEELKQSLEADEAHLQKDLGADYKPRQQDISRYFKESNISDTEVMDLVEKWGYRKTFHFFDRYAQMNKEPQAGSTFEKKEGGRSHAQDGDKHEEMLKDKEFFKKLINGDAEASKQMRENALNTEYE